MKHILSILLALFALQAQATTYNFCQCAAGANAACVAGSDANGTPTTSTPWQTNSKINSTLSTTAVAGDVLQLCRGGAFLGSRILLQKFFSATNPVVFQDYTPSWMANTATGSGGTVTYTGSTLTDTSKAWTVNAWAGYTARVAGLNGTTQEIPIVSNTATVLTLAKPWIVSIIPAAGATYTLQAPRPLLLPDDTAAMQVSGTDAAPAGGINFKNLQLTCTIDSGTATATSATTLTDTTKTWTVNAWAGRRLTTTMEFDPATISSNTANAITISSAWTPSTPGVGIAYKIQSAWGFYLANQVGYVTADNLYVTGCANDGLQWGMTSGSYPPHHLKFINGEVSGNFGGGALLAASYLLVENSLFYGNGQSFFDHNIYLGSAEALIGNLESKQNIVRNNSILNEGVGGVGTCNSVSVVVHGWYTDLIFENNFLREDTMPTSSQCFGFAIGTGHYAYPYDNEGFYRVKVRDNQVANFYVGIWLDQCVDCVIENNDVYADYILYGPFGILVGDGSAAQPANNASTTRMTIRNNSVYFNSPTAAATGIELSHRGTGHIVTSNLIYMGPGSTASTSCFSVDGGDTNTIHTQGLPASAFATFDYNLCYYAGTQGAWAYYDGAGTPSTKAAFTSWSGAAAFDTNSLTTSPSLSAPTAPNYSITIPTGSVAKNAGHPTKSSPTTRRGLKRDQGVPDIGSFEFGATTVMPAPVSRVEVN